MKKLLLSLLFILFSAISTLATQITVSQVTIPNWNGVTTVEARIYYDQAFISSTGQTIQPGSPGGGGFFTKYTCSVSGGNLVFPSSGTVTLTSTVDGKNYNNRVVSVYFFNTATGAMLQPYQGFQNIRIPATPTTTTWADLAVYNAAGAPLPSDFSTYTKDQINAMLANVMSSFTGILAVNQGGTGADRSATGGTGFLVHQDSAGASFSVGALLDTEVPASIQRQITFREVDLNPSLNATIFEIDQSTGLKLTNTSGRAVLSLNMGTIPSNPSSGQILVGNAGSYALATPTGGNGVTVTVGAGSLAITGTQNLATTGSPSFAGLTLNYTGAPGPLQFTDTSGNYTLFRAPTSPAVFAANMVLVLPTTMGSANQYMQLASVTGSNPVIGQLSWVTATGVITAYNEVQVASSTIGTPATRTKTNFLTTTSGSALITGTDNGGAGSTDLTFRFVGAGSTAFVGNALSVAGDGSTISGGGVLTGNVTLAQIAKSAIQKLEFQHDASRTDGTDIGSTATAKSKANFIGGTGVSVNIYPDTVDTERVNILLTNTAGGAGITGSGAANKIAKWTGLLTQSTSMIDDNGSRISIPTDLYINPASGAGNLRIYGNATNYILLTTPTGIGTNRTITLPSAAPAANNFVATDASGNWSYSALVQSLALTSTAGVTLSGATGALTLNIGDADASNRGLVSTGSQSFAGIKTFTSNSVISNSNPILTLDETDATKKLVINQNVNIAEFRDTSATAYSLLNLDLVNGRVGIGYNNPSTLFGVKGTFELAGSTSGAVTLRAPATGGAANFILPATDSAGYLKSDGASNLSIGSAYNLVKNDAGTGLTARSTLKFQNGTNTTVAITDTGGETVVAYSSSGGASGVSSLIAGDDVTVSAATGDVTLGRTAYNDNYASFTVNSNVLGVAPQTGTLNTGTDVYYYVFYLPYKLKFTKISFASFTGLAGPLAVTAGVYSYSGTTATRIIATNTLTSTVATVMTFSTLTGTATAAGEATLNPGFYAIGYSGSASFSVLGTGATALTPTAYALFSQAGAFGKAVAAAPGSIVPASFTMATTSTTVNQQLPIFRFHR